MPREVEMTHSSYYQCHFWGGGKMGGWMSGMFYPRELVVFYTIALAVLGKQGNFHCNFWWSTHYYKGWANYFKDIDGKYISAYLLRRIFMKTGVGIWMPGGKGHWKLISTSVLPFVWVFLLEVYFIRNVYKTLQKIFQIISRLLYVISRQE